VSTAPSTTTALASPWRVVAIGAVAVLAVGIGVAAGSFLLTSGSGSLGVGASYVSADAPFYVELRVEPSAAQDETLRGFLSSFPPIEGVDLDRPLYEQLTQKLDETLAEGGAVDFTWSEDVAPWFDGSVAVAVTDLPLDALAAASDPMAEPPVPGMVVVVGVTDAAAARATADRLVAEMPEGATFSETEYRGVTIRAGDGPEGGAYAVTDDALLFAPDAAGIQTALDDHADAGTTVAGSDELSGFTAELPSDWLAFVAYDMRELMSASWQQMGSMAPEMTDAFSELLDHQSLRGAMAMSAGSDRLSMDVVSEAPTGPFAPANVDRGLADEIPGDALYYAEGGNIGQSLAAVVDPIKEAVAATPDGEAQITMIEAALGADLSELVSWIDDGAVAVGWDGSALYAGAVLVPTDVDAADRRLGQLATFASLASLDPSTGISVDEREVAGSTVTTIHWEDPSAESSDLSVLAMPVTGVTVEFTVTDDRALVGIGEGFVERVLTLDGGSLADEPRYTEAIAEFGGASNAGSAWIDLAGIRTAAQEALGPMLDDIEGSGSYEAELQPWLLPLDRVVQVSTVEGELVVQRFVLLVE
jgi:Protein of unknown function (DUF3352)